MPRYFITYTPLSEIEILMQHLSNFRQRCYGVRWVIGFFVQYLHYLLTPYRNPDIIDNG